MVADAAGAGHEITVRLVRDWTQTGLLDGPRKRPAGRGRGSNQALYPANQRELLLTLLSKRAGNGISSLARIPRRHMVCTGARNACRSGGRVVRSTAPARSALPGLCVRRTLSQTHAAWLKP